MCGIIGYTPAQTESQPNRDILDVLLDGLSDLEYRGYDSAGVAITNSSVSVYKRNGELSGLKRPFRTGQSGIRRIGHTRWSTPRAALGREPLSHTDCNGSVAVVHNGIIENYRELREGTRCRTTLSSTAKPTPRSSHI